MTVQGALCVWAKCTEFKKQIPSNEPISGSIHNFESMLLKGYFFGGEKTDMLYDNLGANLNNRKNLAGHRARRIRVSHMWFMMTFPYAGMARCGKMFCLRTPFKIDKFVDTFLDMFCQSSR